MKNGFSPAIDGRSVCFALTAIFVGAVVWASLANRLDRIFFDRRLPLAERLNTTMEGVAFDGRLQEIRFRFVPSDQARSVYVVLGYRQLDRPFSALRLSSLTDLPSAFLRFDNGWPSETIAFPDRSSSAPREVVIRFQDGQVQVDVNGARSLAIPARDENTALDFAMYPANMFYPFAPPLWAVDSCRVIWRDADGSVHITASLSARRQNLLAIGGGAAAIVLLILLDRFLRRSVARFRKRPWIWLGRFLLTYPSWLFVAILGAVILVNVWEHNRRKNLDATWYGRHVKENRFDAASFLAHPVLRRGGKIIPVNMDPAVRRILVFGGSTSYGFPYESGNFDWPTRLGAMLDQRFAASGPRFQVVNLAFNGNYMENNFPPFVAEFLAAARPDVVIIDNLFNEYYKDRALESVAHMLGFRRYRSRERPAGLAAFLKSLAAAIDAGRAAGARVIVVEPQMDRFYFDGDPLLAWQQAQARVVQEHGGSLISLRTLMDETPQRLIFYEYMHPSRLGYALIAGRIFDSLFPVTEPLAPEFAGG